MIKQKMIMNFLVYFFMVNTAYCAEIKDVKKESTTSETNIDTRTNKLLSYVKNLKTKMLARCNCKMEKSNNHQSSCEVREVALIEQKLDALKAEIESQIESLNEDAGEQLNALNKKLKNALIETKELVKRLAENASIKSESISVNISEFTKKTEEQVIKLLEQIKELKNDIIKRKDEALAEISENTKDGYEKYGLWTQIKEKILLVESKLSTIKEELMEDIKKVPETAHTTYVSMKSKIETEITVLKASIERLEKQMAETVNDYKSLIIEESKQYDEEMFNELFRKTVEMSVQEVKRLQTLLIRVEKQANEMIESYPEGSKLKDDIVLMIKDAKIHVIDATKKVEDLVSKYRHNIAVKKEELKDLSKKIKESIEKTFQVLQLCKKQSEEKLEEIKNTRPPSLYKSKEGDSVLSIAKDWGTDEEKILEANPNLKDPIESGTLINLPSS